MACILEACDGAVSLGFCESVLLPWDDLRAASPSQTSTHITIREELHRRSYREALAPVHGLAWSSNEGMTTFEGQQTGYVSKP